MRYQTSFKGREQRRLAQQRYRERKAAKGDMSLRHLSPTIEPDVRVELLHLHLVLILNVMDQSNSCLLSKKLAQPEQPYAVRYR